MLASFRNRVPARWRADVLAIACLLLGIILVMAHRWHYDNWLTEYDVMTFFLPWFNFTGEQIRAGHIPAWTPHFLSGAPVAGDPSGGWWYFPVMIAFAAFDVLEGFKVMVIMQLVIGSLATYALARRIGLLPLPAFAATAAFTFGPWFAGMTMFTTVAGQVNTWIPVAMLATDCSLTSRRWVSRGAWWALAGFALGQMATSWPGQGMISGWLLVAAWIGYRTLLSPPTTARAWRDRAIDLVTTGAGSFVFAGLLGAAGILPRLAVNADSSIAGGDYSGVMAGGYQPAATVLQMLRQMLVDTQAYRPLSVGVVVMALAMLAPFLARTRYTVPFLATAWVVSIILALHETPLHRLFFLIPEFEKIHEHSPQRIVWITFICPALLVGATIQSLLEERQPAHILWLVPFPLAALGAAMIWLWQRDKVPGWLPVIAAVATGIALVVTLVLAQIRPARRDIILRSGACLLILLTIFFPTGKDIVDSIFRTQPLGTYLSTDARTQDVLATYTSRTDPGGAGEFLQQQRDNGEIFRYVGFAGRDPLANRPSYSGRRSEPEVLAILVNARAPRLGLEMIQGYNPTHILWYDQLIDAMNSGKQDYHWSDPSFTALEGDNQILDMLNVRYIIVAHNDAKSKELLPVISEGRTVVFQDDMVTVLENPSAFDRAWIVHTVHHEDASAGLTALANGTADARTVAFIADDQPLPTVSPVIAPGQDTVTITSRSDTSLTATATTDAAGVVVFSEIYANGWSVTVDGKPAELLRTNHALRGVAVPAGTHTIAMRYAPQSLRVGLILSGIGFGAAAILTGATVALWFRDRRVETVEEPALS
ncbi:MAG: YfhO family protein [Thermomicrobiales bacterium]